MSIGNQDAERPRGAFATTHWSLILAAQGPSTPEARSALENLCRIYWYPLYAYLRRVGHSAHDAQDLTQEFLARFVGKHTVQEADRRLGRFRNFLLGTLKHFLSDIRKHATAQKRGGGQTVISIDEALAESRYHLEPAGSETPEILFERCWGVAVLERSLERLRHRYERAGKGDWFASLQPCLVGGKSAACYAEIAARFGMSEGAVKTAVHRLRKEYGLMLRSEIGATLESSAEVDEEIRHLLRLTGGV